MLIDLFVDDLTIFGDHEEKFSQDMKTLSIEFEMTYLELMNFFFFEVQDLARAK